MIEIIEEKEEVFCVDSRPCILKGPGGGCTELESGYRKDGQCPFCKAHPDDKGRRSRGYEDFYSGSPELIGHLTGLYK